MRKQSDREAQILVMLRNVRQDPASLGVFDSVGEKGPGKKCPPFSIYSGNG